MEISEIELQAMMQRAVDDERRNIALLIHKEYDLERRIPGNETYAMERAYTVARRVAQNRIGQPVEIPHGN